MRGHHLCLGLMSVFLILGISGCKSEREAVVEEMVSTMEQIGDRLSRIKTNTDLVDAKPDLQRLGAKIKDQERKMQQIGEPQDDEREAFEKKYKARLEKAGDRLQMELMRLTRELGPIAPAQVMAEIGMGAGELGDVDLD